MKTTKRIIAIGLASAIVLSSSMTALGLPGNTVVVGNRAFSMDYFFQTPLIGEITSEIGKGGDIFYDPGENGDNFKNAWTGAPITDVQKAGLTNIEYLNSDGSTDTYANFDDKTPISTELSVVGAVAKSSTTIEFTFSNNHKEIRSGYQLVEGVNHVTVNYNNKTYNVDVTYHETTPNQAAVEKIEFVNYRNLRVTFNTVVDNESAANAANYYFEIVDGNVAYGAIPDLGLSNQLSKIETVYRDGAEEWWYGEKNEDGEWISPRHITASDANGKTVVEICLPEDARFTTLKDVKLLSENDNDDERTLTVLQRTSMPEREGDRKYLIKNTNLNVAVRNVLDKNKKATIDTVVKPILILDEVKPKLVAVDAVGIEGETTSLLSNGSGLGVSLGNFELLREKEYYGHEHEDQYRENLRFTYSEPVFDAHDLDKSDLETYRDINLYVNGKLVASTKNADKDGETDATVDYTNVLDLKDVVTFNMEKDHSYGEGTTVTIDAQKAAEQLELWGEYFLTDKPYEFRLVGVTDLAGNIEESSEHKFSVIFVDDLVDNPVPPVALGIEQVGDNMFRVEFNREGVRGQLEILNADGKDGILYAPIPRSVEDDGKFYSYVQVWAMDNELFDPIVNINTLKKENILVYGGSDYINRTVTVKDISANHGLLIGDKLAKNMTLYNDIFAPKVENNQLVDIEHTNRNPHITIPVVDVVPQSWAADDNAIYSTRAVRYIFDTNLSQFTNSVDFNNGDYLPINVWYEVNGERHSALVNNQEPGVRPHDYLPGSVDQNAYLNPGHADSITFDEDDFELNLDLSKYPELLDNEGKLVAGVTYHVDIPAGYFTDDGRDIILRNLMRCINNHDATIGLQTSTRFNPIEEYICYLLHEYDFEFGKCYGEKYDLLYVDDARIPQLASLINDIKEGKIIDECKLNITQLGYVSLSDFKVTVNVKKDDTVPAMTVPQTSKELIWFDEAKNTINVEFTGDIDIITLKNPANYSINGKRLSEYGATSDNIIYDITHGKKAVITMPQDTIAEDNDYSFKVEGVSNTVGGTMTPVETVIHLHDNTHPYIVSAKITAQKEIQLTYNEGIKYFVEAVPTADKFSAAKNFIVKDAKNQKYAVTEAIRAADINPNERIIVLKLADLDENVEGLTVSIVKDQNNQINFIDLSTNRNTLKLETVNATK